MPRQWCLATRKVLIDLQLSKNKIDTFFNPKSLGIVIAKTHDYIFILELVEAVLKNYIQER